MKTLKNLLLIGGLTGLVLGSLKSYGQPVFTEEAYEKSHIDKVRNLSDKAYVFFMDGLNDAIGSRAYPFYEEEPKKFLLSELNNSLNNLDSCISSLEEYTKYSNNTGHYTWTFFDNNNYFYARGEYQTPLTFSKAKETLFKVMELKNMENEVLDKIKSAQNNLDEINQFKPDLDSLVNKYRKYANREENGL